MFILGFTTKDGTMKPSRSLDLYLGMVSALGLFSKDSYPDNTPIRWEPMGVSFYIHMCPFWLLESLVHAGATTT